MVRVLLRYGFVGIANTALTLVVVFVLLRLNTHPAIANVAGYAVGLTNSYLMNRSFTFGARRHPLLPFLISYAISYSANFVVVMVLATITGYRSMLPHLTGMAIYNIIFFLLMKLWVFSENERT